MLDIPAFRGHGNSNAPTKRFFLKMPAQLALWARKKVVAREPTPTVTGTKRERERERGREREWERDRERKRERERETDGSEPPTAGIPKIRKQNLRKNIFRELFCKIAKTNFTKINSRRIIYGNYAFGTEFLKKITQKISQGIIVVIISCQSVNVLIYICVCISIYKYIYMLSSQFGDRVFWLFQS